jgi:arginyl-tRNA synthetase
MRFLMDDQKELSMARLALVQGLITVLSSGLQVLGVRPMEEMR